MSTPSGANNLAPNESVIQVDQSMHGRLHVSDSRLLKLSLKVCAIGGDRNRAIAIV